MVREARVSRLWRFATLPATGLVVLAVSVIVFRRGLLLGDEGYILGQSLAVAGGKVPYRDLDMFVAPGIWLLNAALFKALGPSVLLSRVPVAVCYLLTIATAYWIVRTTSGRTWALAVVALFVAFLLWAFPAWSFSFYSPFAALSVVVALALQLAWVRRPTAGKLFATGVAVGFGVAFKQNYGVYGGAAATVVVAAVTIAHAGTMREASRRVVSRLVVVALGGLCVVLPLVAYLSAAGAGPAMIDSLLIRPFHGFAEHHAIAYPPFGELWRQRQIMAAGGLVYLPPLLFVTGGLLAWPAWVLTVVKALDVLLYWLPVALLAGGVMVGLRRHRGEEPDWSLLVIVVFAAFLFLGVFPRADFNHLANVYQPFLILSVVLVQRLVARVDWPMRSAVIAPVVLLFGCYCAFGAVWLRDVRRMLSAPLASERGGVFVDPLTASLVNYQVGAIRALTAAGDSVLAMPGLATLPFLAERPMATGYYNYYAVHIGHDAGARAAAEAEVDHTKLVVSGYGNFFSDPVGMLTYAPLLTEYVRTNFHEVFSAPPRQQSFLVRRQEPLPVRRRSHLLADCWTATVPAEAGFVAEHVLLRSLYQSISSAEPFADTLCRTTVPEDGELRFALGMRTPDAASSDAHVVAEIWILPETGTALPATRVFEADQPVVPISGWVGRPATEDTVDLRRYAGQQVVLVFRSRLLGGEVTMNPFAPGGFAVGWDGPVIESPPLAASRIGEEPDLTGRHSIVAHRM
ncbi:MAG: hypothetical protein IT293_00090 [Deltaproteobacteria bacterium]|nr:hypothetical protein [Deltaproteobacteria bacterium]